MNPPLHSATQERYILYVLSLWTNFIAICCLLRRKACLKRTRTPVKRSMLHPPSTMGAFDAHSNLKRSQDHTFTSRLHFGSFSNDYFIDLIVHHTPHYQWPLLQILIGLTTSNIVAFKERWHQSRSHRPVLLAPKRFVHPFTPKHKASNCAVADRVYYADFPPLAHPLTSPRYLGPHPQLLST